eukprot:Lithocolla_globosa_v1_NODE_5314_length_1262_cov_66.482187.p1 type:complete len:172 gc:universal NODE_5314_length_1262_cov_66.482187:383-898(+)
MEELTNLNYEDVMNRLTGVTIQTVRGLEKVEVAPNNQAFQDLMIPISPETQLACVKEFCTLTHVDRIPSFDHRCAVCVRPTADGSELNATEETLASLGNLQTLRANGYKTQEEPRDALTVYTTAAGVFCLDEAGVVSVRCRHNPSTTHAAAMCNKVRCKTPPKNYIDLEPS